MSPPRANYKGQFCLLICLPLWKRSVIAQSGWQTFILLVYVPYLNGFTAYCRCYFALMIHCPLLIWWPTQTLKKSSLPNACFSTQYDLVFFHHFRIFVGKWKGTNYSIFCITALSSIGNIIISYHWAHLLFSGVVALFVLLTLQKD